MYGITTLILIYVEKYGYWLLNAIPFLQYFLWLNYYFLQFLSKLLFWGMIVCILLFTVKVLEKRHIIREKKSQYVSREKEVLSRLNHPFFVRLYFTFQDKEKLCILHTKTLFIISNRPKVSMGYITIIP